MTLTTQTIASVGSAGSWVSSAGDLAAALQSLDGEYAISPITSSNMWLASPSFTTAVGSDTINSVTIRVRARTATIGQSGQITVGYTRTDISPIFYNTNPGTSYTDVAADGQWAWYDYPYTVIPDTLAPFQAADLPGAGWNRVYVRYYGSSSAVEVDRVEIVVDHSTAGPGPVREGTINDASALYVGSAPVTRAYLGSELVWGSAP